MGGQLDEKLVRLRRSLAPGLRPSSGPFPAHRYPPLPRFTSSSRSTGSFTEQIEPEDAPFADELLQLAFGRTDLLAELLKH